jgi:hypothetical protein
MTKKPEGSKISSQRLEEVKNSQGDSNFDFDLMILPGRACN